MNKKLRSARLKRNWTIEDVCSITGLSERQYRRWEHGMSIPRLSSLALLCKAFDAMAEELGFTHTTEQDGEQIATPVEKEEVFEPWSEGRDWGTWFGIKQAQLMTMIDTWPGGDALSDTIQLMIDQEIRAIDRELQMQGAEEQQRVTRRQALFTLAALPTAFLLARGVQTDALLETFLARCAASVTSCWHLMKSAGFVAVADILAQFASQLQTAALHPSRLQREAARISTQASILQGILAMHQLDFTTREAHCHNAVRYATIAQDRLLQAAALMYVAYTYSHCYYPRQPQKAIQPFRQALQMLGETPSLLRSDILMGLSEAYAQCHEEQEALRCMGLAQEHFPLYPEQDPSFIYADCGTNTLYQWQGKMYLELVNHHPDAGYQQKAAESLMQSIGVGSISERSINETAIYRANSALVLNELEIYADTLQQAAQMALHTGSRRRFHDAHLVLQQTPEQWFKEPRIQALSKDVFHVNHLPSKKG
jgi:transcriptional regulator with XRE-family HTH domain